jgi:hypothetical protein
VITAQAQPLWPSELTAWGTIAVAIAAVGVALFGELRTNNRFQRQLQMTVNQLSAERIEAADREQRTVALAVAVDFSRYTGANDPGIRFTARPAERGQGEIRTVAVENHSVYPITGITVDFSCDGVGFAPAAQAKAGTVQANVTGYAPIPEGFSMPLAAGQAISFASDLISTSDLSRPRVRVAWIDAWLNRWEHSGETLRLVKSSKLEP